VKTFDGYQHTQAGTVTRAILGGLMLFLLSLSAAALAAGKTQQAIAVVWPVGILLVILLLLLLLFHSLTIRVTGDVVHLSFGIGLVHRVFPIREIESAEATRTRWYNGWGIKKIRGGWLFNISGFGAVELKMRNGRRYLLGSDEPEKLREAIAAAMALGGQ